MAEMIQYKCPCCGGALEFSSDLQKMKCPYCDTEFEVETLKELDDQLKTEGEDELTGRGRKEVNGRKRKRRG